MNILQSLPTAAPAMLRGRGRYTAGRCEAIVSRKKVDERIAIDEKVRQVDDTSFEYRDNSIGVTILTKYIQRGEELLVITQSTWIDRKTNRTRRSVHQHQIHTR